MYDPHELLREIDANIWPMVLVFGLSMAFQAWWLIESARVARRDHAYSIPLFCTYFWFAHDLGGVLHFREWFFFYDHWYLKCYWFVLLGANLIEWYFLWQVYQYGRQELCPRASPRVFLALLASGQAFTVVSFIFLKQTFGDPLFQMDLMLTILVYPALGAALLLRRQSARGQSPAMWWTFTAMTALWAITTYLWFTPEFRSWPCVAADIAATLAGAAMAIVVAKPHWRDRLAPVGTASAS